MIDVCDSCGEDRELKEYKDWTGEPFYWCDECKEEEDRFVELPHCERCDRPTEEDEMAGAVCISCETQSEVNYWRGQ